MNFLATKSVSYTHLFSLIEYPTEILRGTGSLLSFKHASWILFSSSFKF